MSHIAEKDRAPRMKVLGSSYFQDGADLRQVSTMVVLLAGKVGHVKKSRQNMLLVNNKTTFLVLSILDHYSHDV